MHRAAILLVVSGALVSSAGLSAAAIATPSAAVAPVIGADGAVLAIHTPSRDVNGSLHAVVSGAKWRITGSVSIYIPGQTVDVTVFRGARRIALRTVAITPGPSHTAAPVGSTGVSGTTGTTGTTGATGTSGPGEFTTSFHMSGAGELTVQATHALTTQEELLVSDPVHLHLVGSEVQPEQKGLAVRILQVDLSREHYVVGAPGIYDARTQRAVVAFRKVADMPRTTVVNDSVFKALAAGRGKFKVLYPKSGRHVEGDLTHQVLALIGANGKVQHIYPISSGKPSTPTQPGNFVVWLREPGVNNDGMVDSSFFNGGDAIHGYDPVPAYPASHGCLRVPIPDALAIYDWIGGTGIPVNVYYR
jgi:hypothetical protein